RLSGGHGGGRPTRRLGAGRTSRSVVVVIDLPGRDHPGPDVDEPTSSPVRRSVLLRLRRTGARRLLDPARWTALPQHARVRAVRDPADVDAQPVPPWAVVDRARVGGADRVLGHDRA